MHLVCGDILVAQVRVKPLHYYLIITHTHTHKVLELFFIIFTASHDDSDWSHHTVGGATATTSDHHKWPEPSSQQSRNSHDIIITSQDTLQSVLASVGLIEHMELFQVLQSISCVYIY